MKFKNLFAWIAAVSVITLAVGNTTGYGQEEADIKAPQIEPGCKVAFVNLARVLEESVEGKKMKDALEAEKEKAFAPLKSRQAELEQLEQQISTLTQEIMQKGQIWDPQTRLYKQQELQNLQMRYQNIIQQLQLDKQKIQDELNRKKDEMLAPLEEKLNKIMKEIGEKGGYCLVLDVMPPSPVNPILFYDTDRDITDQLIEAVDK